MDSNSSQLSIYVNGCRGSAQANPKSKYGSYTSCLSFVFRDVMYILDAGSGLNALGCKMRKEPDKFPTNVVLLLSHAHIDHTIGLYTFQPIYDSGYNVSIYGSLCGGISPEDWLKDLLRIPYWPVEFNAVVSNTKVTDISQISELNINSDCILSCYKGSHPGGAVLFQLKIAGKVLSYCLDNEVSLCNEDSFLKFAAGSDLICWDSSFDEKDYVRGWGHSTWQEGLGVLSKTAADKILMLHHLYTTSDDELDRRAKLCKNKSDKCLWAFDGMRVDL